MAQHGYELEHLKVSYPEVQADSLEGTIEPALAWLASRCARPMMIDDSGLFIDALNGFPGVYSSYVYKTLGCEGILRLMAGMNSRGARFECCIGFMVPAEEPFLAKGVAKGSISETARGSGGFGYDPIFVPEEYDRTYAEMDTIEKNELSHRGRAIESLLEALPNLLQTP